MMLASRSREGAWIEILSISGVRLRRLVAPARERGLKFSSLLTLTNNNKVAPARERGLKLAYAGRSQPQNKVAPARERGLKS